MERTELKQRESEPFGFAAKTMQAILLSDRFPKIGRPVHFGFTSTNLSYQPGGLVVRRSDIRS